MKSLKKHQSWSNIVLFESEAACRAMEKFLEGKGFEARSYNDRWLQLFLFLCPPRLTYRLQVRADEFQAAVDLLKGESTPLLDQAMHCPSCGSLQVNYPQMTRKFFLPTLVLHLGIIFRIIEHQCYCEHCHFMWDHPSKGALNKQPAKPAKIFPFD
ncbi:MAG TPA: hypothetical protein VGO57_12160 [Verrucomicrobiae bacterium]|jgi:hypothetical protein